MDTQDTQDLRVGLVGGGYVSPYHIRALQTLPLVQIVGIADAAIDRARQLAQQFNIPYSCGSLDELQTTRPNVIHILTPPASHCALAVKALGFGCHVFVEKPMAPTVAECDEMIEAARRAGRVLSVNHSAVADPIIVRALDLVNAGACGDVLAVDFCRSSDYPAYAGGPVTAPYRDGGYPFQDIGIHALCLMEAFLGRIRDVDVRYRSTGRHPNVFFDDWRGIVECEKGMGQFFLSWAARPMRNELYIHGTRGYVHVDCFLQTCTVHKSLPGPKAITGPIDATVSAGTTLYKVPVNMLRFLTKRLRPSPGIHDGVLRFYDALRREAPQPVSAEDGRRLVGWTEEPCHRAAVEKDLELRPKEAASRGSVLVTGAAGFLGRALVARLQAQGESVRVMVRRPGSAIEQTPGLDVVYGDLGDPSAVDRAVAGVRTVYHVGATMRGRGWDDFQAGTVCGTTNVVNACLLHGVERLVYVSSLTVLDYAGQRSGASVQEDAPLEPHPDRRGAYTKSKLLAEKIVMDAIRERGLQAVVLRPGQIFGPGAESVPPYGTIAIAGRWIVVGSGQLRCPLVHVDDVVDAMVSAADRADITGSIFHLVDQSMVTQDEYIEDCRKALPQPPRVLHVPRSVLFAAGAALEVLGRVLKRGVPLTRYRVQAIRELRFDCSSAARELDWEPQLGASREPLPALAAREI
jgi:predicted dehydrogenase/nucleoside-diphosphate-sugar epimerase